MSKIFIKLLPKREIKTYTKELQMAKHQNEKAPKSAKQKKQMLQAKRQEKQNKPSTAADPRQKNTPQAVTGKSFGAKTY